MLRFTCNRSNPLLTRVLWSVLMFSIAPSFSHWKRKSEAVTRILGKLENLDNSWGIALRYSTRDENIVANVRLNLGGQVRSIRELVKVGDSEGGRGGHEQPALETRHALVPARLTLQVSLALSYLEGSEGEYVKAAFKSYSLTLMVSSPSPILTYLVCLSSRFLLCSHRICSPGTVLRSENHLKILANLLSAHPSLC